MGAAQEDSVQGAEAQSQEPQLKVRSSRPSAVPGWMARILDQSAVAGEIETPAGAVVRVGNGAPLFRVRFRRNDLKSRPEDEFSLGRAYVNGEIDLEGDMLALLEARSQLADRFRLWHWLRSAIDLLSPATRVNKKVIDAHYTLGNDFYLSFLDSRYRFYSQCLFASDDEPLEDAAEHKLETTFRALRLRPGMHLLDIGAGWGGTFQYCSPRGVRMTGLTLFDDSCSYISSLIMRQRLQGQISLRDFLTYKPAEPFDAIVMYGVIEHIPDYPRFFSRVRQCLRPGGRIYLDGAASKHKYSMSQFTRQYTWQGSHSFMYLPELVQAAVSQGFRVEEVKDESHDYELTMLHWARRFDRIRQKLVAGWGEQVYRSFRLFLWGGCHAFRTDRLQAYHLVARR
jgi:cyclopropane-fatty-acyl-phospholipid synthase